MKKDCGENFFTKLKTKILAFSYNKTQRRYAKMQVKKSGITNVGTKRRQDAIFYTLILIFPMLQFLLYYVVVNFNSFLMAFQKYDNTLGRYYWVGMDNIVEQVHEFMGGGILREAVFSSIKLYFLNLLVLPFSILFPYYIYKKLWGSGFFKVILFLPQILSSMVLCMLYQFFMNSVIPDLATSFGGKVAPLLYGDTAFITAWGYTAVFGFTTVLMYHGSMVSIPKSVVEYARIDGCSLLQEFWYITLPNIMPTIVVYLISGISSMFSEQMNLFVYFNGNITHAVTVGYVIFARSTGTGMAAYPVPATIGLLSTVVVTPLVIVLRHFAKKYTSVA